MKVEEILSQHNKAYIVGAQSRAKTLSGYFSFLYPQISIEAYLVDNPEENEAEIQGVPVYCLDGALAVRTEYPVFIATKGIFHAEITSVLERIGFSIIVPVTVDVDNFLRNAYVQKNFAEKGRRFRKIDEYAIQYSGTDEEPDFCIYMAKSIYDKPLKSHYVPPDYERPIQVGAALTPERLSPDILTDDIGDNISVKNRQYCELTALYWIWKHAKEDVVGLSHYRRHFILPKNWQRLFTQYNIDVILPVPTYVQPSIEANYKERHDPEDWDFMLEYMKGNYPGDYKTAGKVYAGNLYSPCNMFIMRNDILNDLCGWMFPLIDVVTEHGGERKDTYLNRYPGFIAERLLTFFFDKYQERYNIVYADKNFIG